MQTMKPGARARRLFLAATGLGIGGVLLAKLRTSSVDEARAASNESFEVTHTEAEWRALLSPNAYAVLREQATERAFTSPLDHEKRHGIFACAGCALDLFSSETKFDSGTGWPSFYKPLPHAVAENKDFLLGFARDEVHCRRCGGHLGHVFDDGPPPTGLRYCMNGVALAFKPAA
jgi:peptide-methionine (R)-S-oxide reductase